MTYACPYCPSVSAGSGSLLKHLWGRRLYGGHQIPRTQAELIVERIGSGTVKPPALPRVAEGTLLRRGHWRSLELLENAPAVRDTLAAYDSALGHAVYLRPTRKGLTVMSLDPASPAMIAVGGTSDCCIDVLPPLPSALDAAVEAYRAKLTALKRRSVEERYVLGRVRTALTNGLELGDGLLFLHQEWRLSGARKIDLLGLDRQTGQLVVIEAKKSVATAAHPGAAEQAADYVAELTAHAAECLPYFDRLAAALARVYRAEGELPRVNLALPPRWEIWWPEGRFRQSSHAPPSR